MRNTDTACFLEGKFPIGLGQTGADGRHGNRGSAMGLKRGHGNNSTVHATGKSHGAGPVGTQP